MNVSVDIASDIYLDSWVTQINEISDFVKRILPNKKNSEILILAGNINSSLKTIKHFLFELKKYYKYIFYIHGNHEMYLLDKDEYSYGHNSFQKINQLKSLVESIEGCRFLDGFDSKQVVLPEYNNLSITGLSMWWNQDKKVYTNRTTRDLYRKYSNDYKFISFAYRKGNKFNYSKLFRNFYKKLTNLPPSDIMVTHYSPVRLSEKSSIFNFFNGLEELKRLNPKIWICGHTFERYNLKFDETQIVTNPIGYGKFNKELNSINTIKIEK